MNNIPGWVKTVFWIVVVLIVIALLKFHFSVKINLVIY